MSQQPLNPIKVTAQAGDRENWAAARTKHLANHPPEEKEINQLKKALKDLVVFTNHHRGRTRHHPPNHTFTKSYFCHFSWRKILFLSYFLGLQCPIFLFFDLSYYLTP